MSLEDYIEKLAIQVLELANNTTLLLNRIKDLELEVKLSKQRITSLELDNGAKRYL